MMPMSFIVAIAVIAITQHAAIEHREPQARADAGMIRRLRH